jgi:hypothetical protein
MKKLTFIHLPVAVALAFCFTACSDNSNGNSITAPSTMCWDEEWTYSNLVDNDSEALAAFIEANQCYNAYDCAGIKMTVHRCVDNVEFK